MAHLSPDPLPAHAQTVGVTDPTRTSQAVRLYKQMEAARLAIDNGDTTQWDAYSVADDALAWVKAGMSDDEMAAYHEQIAASLGGA